MADTRETLSLFLDWMSANGVTIRDRNGEWPGGHRLVESFLRERADD